MWTKYFSGDIPVTAKVKYDKIVDRTDFRPNAAIRDRRLGVVSSSGSSTPSYDYPDGKVTRENKVTNEELQIRSGKLDKTEVAALAKKVTKKARAEVRDDAVAKRVKREVKRQKAIDKELGLEDTSS